MGKRAKLEPHGYWRYIGDGTRIPGVPRRDLKPEETARFDEWIRQVNAAGQVLYEWVETAAPVVLATAPAPEWTVDMTASGESFADATSVETQPEAGSDE